MTKIGEAFQNFRDRIRAAVSVKTQNFLFFLALTLIIIVAIMIRLTPILRGPTLIKAFDPWIQYYNAKYITEHSLYDYFHWHDYKSWYPQGIDRSNLYPGLPFSAATIYFILNFLGIPVSIYDVCYYFPAFMGGLTCLAAYFLGKEVYDRNCGLLAAFFLAFNTGHMQRTMAGFFDNETIGVFATLMTFVFFLKTIKTGKIIHSLLGGLFLSYLAISWGGYTYVYLLIPLICGILVIMKKYNSNVLIAYAGVEGTALILQSIYIKFSYSDLFSELKIGGVFFFTIILFIFHIIYTKRLEYPKFYNGLINVIRWLLIPGGLIAAIIIWINPNLIPLGVGSRFQSILNPLIRDQFHITASVAEHMPSAWSVFYYNTLIPLMLIPLGIFFCFKRGDAADIFMVIYLLTLYYFTGSMIRIILLFAPVASLLGAYGLVNVLKIFGSYVGEKKIELSRKRKRQVKRTIGNGEIFGIFLIVGVLCTAQVFHGVDISINQLSYSQIVAGGQYHDWEEALTWMKENLHGTDVVVSWWDYGYWLTPIGNVTTVNDNGTINSTRIGLTGMAFMQTNEIYSAKILRLLKADYVLVYFGFLINGLGGDEGKWPWMLRICNDHYEKYKRWGLEEDNWAENAVFDESEYINSSSQKYEDKWFDSQLVHLMFGYEPTDPAKIPNTPENQLRLYYAMQISGYGNTQPRKDDNGNTWKSHIPDNGQYDFKVFRPAYFSRNGMVKIWKVDYTALDSSFSIKNAKVYDNGYATFELKNTGKKNLTIKEVKINDVAYNFTMAENIDDNILPANSEDVIWINYAEKSDKFQIDDVVNISVTAEAQAYGGNTYTFTNYTNNFFVIAGEKSSIRINRCNSVIIQIDETTINATLEVENTGNTIIKIDKFYLNNNEPLNWFNETEYIEGSPILKPGEKARVLLKNKAAPFYPIGMINNTIGVVTVDGAQDNVIFTSNYKNYKLSIINETRIPSPEFVPYVNVSFRGNIPVEVNNTAIIINDDSTKTVKIKVKNTGDIVIGLDSVYLKGERIPVDFDTIDHNLILEPGEENVIIADASDINIDVNDNIMITVTAIDSDSRTAASDIGFSYAVANKSDITILKGYQNFAMSYIMANESGTLLIKNTGIEPVTLDKIIINDTIELSIPDDVNFVYGDQNLDIQEVAIISFNIPTLQINKSNIIKVNVTTDKSAFCNETFTAIVNPPQGPISYLVEIDQSNTTAQEGGTLNIEISNPGGAQSRNVTIDSIYINNTYIPLNQFTYLGLNTNIVAPGTSIYLSIDMTTVNTLTGLNFQKDSKMEILVRTKEGAENKVEITVS